jgi:hypothetical protein
MQEIMASSANLAHSYLSHRIRLLTFYWLAAFKSSGWALVAPLQLVQSGLINIVLKLHGSYLGDSDTSTADLTFYHSSAITSRDRKPALNMLARYSAKLPRMGSSLQRRSTWLNRMHRYHWLSPNSGSQEGCTILRPPMCLPAIKVEGRPKLPIIYHLQYPRPNARPASLATFRAEQIETTIVDYKLQIQFVYWPHKFTRFHAPLCHVRTDVRHRKATADWDVKFKMIVMAAVSRTIIRLQQAEMSQLEACNANR